MSEAVHTKNSTASAMDDGIEFIIGDPSDFAIGYGFLGADRFTVLAMYAQDRNLLGFTNESGHHTTRWAYLDGLVAWLKSLASNMAEDPYPFQVEGEFAAQKDDSAREFDTDDLKEFDDYYDQINSWAWDHTWRHESGGAVLADVFFELKNDTVELSWDNRDPGNDLTFDCEFGGARIDAETFKSVVLKFVDAYEKHWGINVDDDSTWLRKSRT